VKSLAVIFLVGLVLFSLLAYLGNEEPATCLYMSEETAREMGRYRILSYDVIKSPSERKLNVSGEIMNGSSSNLKYVRVKMVQYVEEAKRSGEDFFPVYVKNIKPGETGKFNIQDVKIRGIKHYKSVLTIEPPTSRIMPWKFG